MRSAFPGPVKRVRPATAYETRRWLGDFADVNGFYFTRGNTDGSIAPSSPTSSQSATTDLHFIRFPHDGITPIAGWALRNNGGTAAGVVASGVWTITGCLYDVNPVTGVPGRLLSEPAVITLDANAPAEWVARWNRLQWRTERWLAVGFRINPSFNAGELNRGTVRYDHWRTTYPNPIKIGSQGAFDSAFPQDVRAATFMAWNGGGVGSQLAAYAEMGILYGTPKQ